MTCALFFHSETAAEPRKALWEGVETAVLENTKLKKVAFHMAISYAGIKVVWMIILF